MPAGWPTCRSATEHARPYRPALGSVARWVASVLVLLGIAACTATVVEVEPAVDADGVTGTDVPQGNPGTLAPPTQPAAGGGPGRLGIEPLTAFMDACVADSGLVGPCHCAAGRMEANLTEIDLVVLEDRMSGALEFSPELASVLVECRDAAPPPAWSGVQQQQYLDACSAGSDRLKSLCACSLARAQEVVPAHRLDDFLASTEVQPDIVDFINLCV